MRSISTIWKRFIGEDVEQMKAEVKLELAESKKREGRVMRRLARVTGDDDAHQMAEDLEHESRRLREEYNIIAGRRGDSA